MKTILHCVVAGLILVGCQSSEPSFRATELGENLPLPDFNLTDQENRQFTLSEHRGKVVVLFFGFTYCPDVCPATLSSWRRVQEVMQDEAADLKFVYVTVDPERDTREKLREHLAIFSSEFVGLTGTQSQLDSAYAAFGVYRERVQISDSAAGYIINHTSRMHIIGRNGRWRLGIPHDARVDDIVHDLEILLAEEPEIPSISVSDIWSRPAHAAGDMSSTGVVYLTISNDGDENDRLIGAQSEVAATTELHESLMTDGKMRMQMLAGGVEVLANQQLIFKPHGYHVMLIRLNRALQPGDRFDLVLQFQKAGTVTVQSEVREP